MRGSRQAARGSRQATPDTLRRVGVVRTVVTSALVGVESSTRAGVGFAELTLRRAPSLIALGVRATVISSAGATRADAVFRDELLTLLDDVAELAWRHARRARLELGERTAAAAARNGVPSRRHRVKA
jgi:hypothetical protein